MSKKGESEKGGNREVKEVVRMCRGKDRKRNREREDKRGTRGAKKGRGGRKRHKRVNNISKAMLFLGLTSLAVGLSKVTFKDASE